MIFYIILDKFSNNGNYKSILDEYIFYHKLTNHYTDHTISITDSLILYTFGNLTSLIKSEYCGIKL